MVINYKRRDFLDYFAKYESPLGPLLLISDGTALTGLYLNRQIPEILTELPVFLQAEAWLNAYFRGRPGPVDFPVRACGSPFQEQVWQLLLEILRRMK